MEVWPAIDLRGGKCVRLRQGNYDDETVFGDDPVAMAQRWQGLGAERKVIVILGGDFNVPQGDQSTTQLRDFASDTFGVAGRGWGNTVLNTIPVLRFDQIWASGHFRPIATWAVCSEHSDHRMVVSDMVLPAWWAERGRASSP